MPKSRSASGGNTIRSSGPSETRQITQALQAKGAAYEVHRGRDIVERWDGPKATRSRNPGRGSPGAPPGSPGAPPAVTYTSGPGGFTQAYDGLPTVGWPSLGGSGFPDPNPGYSQPVFDGTDWRMLTADYLAPDGRVLREREGMTGELPELAILLEHMNNNQGYWGQQLREFAGNNPVLTGAVGAVAAGVALRGTVSTAHAVHSYRNRPRGSGFNSAGFNLRAGGAGASLSRRYANRTYPLTFN